jgi:hypothetical protein
VLTTDRYVHSLHDLVGAAGLHLRSWIKVYSPSGADSATGFRSATLHLLHAVRNPERFVFHPEGLKGAIALDGREAKALAILGCKQTDDVWIAPRLKETDAERIPWFPAQRRLALVQPILRCATAEGDWVLDQEFHGVGSMLRTVCHRVVPSVLSLPLTASSEQTRRGHMRLAGVVRGLGFGLLPRLALGLANFLQAHLRRQAPQARRHLGGSQ